MRITIIILGLVMAVQAAWADLRMKQHDCLGATAGTPVTVVVGSPQTGNEVKPLGATSNLAGFVTFSGAGTLEVTVQTRVAGSSHWNTPNVGATALFAVSAGSHQFSIAIPPCEALRLVYTAAVADASVLEALVLEQQEVSQ